MKQKNIIMLLMLLALSLYFAVLMGIFNFPFVVLADSSLNLWISSIQVNALVVASNAIGLMFGTIAMAIYTAIVVYLLWPKDRKWSFRFCLAMVISSITTFGLKFYYSRPRPVNGIISTTDASFPSGHTVSTVVFSGLLIYLAFKYMKDSKSKHWVYAAGISIPVIVMASRLYLNVHWLSDVLGGLMLGLFFVADFIYFDKK